VVNRKRYILLTLALALAIGLQAQDYLRMTERDLQGTARYVGMGGAMTAIGGDPSAVHVNPAGLGLYQRLEVMLTLDEGIDRTRQIGVNTIGKANRLSVAQASVVWAIGTNNADGILFHNIMLSYQRLRTFNRSFYGQSAGDPSLGAVMAANNIALDIPYPSEPLNVTNDLLLDEYGRSQAFGMHWAMNINHQWYVGAGLKVLSYSLSGKGDYEEHFATTNVEGLTHALRNETSLSLSGAGVNGSIGVIYRPIQWVRLGASFETPSYGSLFVNATGTLTTRLDSLRSSKSPYVSDPYRNFHMPLRTSVSAALQIYDKAMIAVQYDYSHQQDQFDTHSIRAGLEIVPVAGLYINAGYTYELMRDRTRKAGYTERPFAIDPVFDRQDTYFNYPQYGHYASAGIGYRGTHAMVQVAYQYHWQKMHLYAHENMIQNPYTIHAETHRIVLTVGWHSTWYR